MLKNLLPFLLLACGSFPDITPEEAQDIGTLDQDFSAKRYYGVKINTGFEHERCDMQSTLSDCGFPVRSTNTNAYRRLLIAPVESTPVPSGFSLTDARTFGTAYFGNMSNDWVFAMTTQGTSADLMIVSDESLFNGTPPNATIDLATIAHISCVWIPFAYTESLNGRAYGCRQFEVRFDVGSFTAWVNLWATNNSQRQGALDSVYRHFLGVALGLGSTNSTDTPMRRRLSRAQSPTVIQNYEHCLLDSSNFNDPNFVDPAFGMYANDCG